MSRVLLFGSYIKGVQEVRKLSLASFDDSKGVQVSFTFY